MTSAPVKDSYLMIEIQWGDLASPTYLRRTNWNDDVESIHGTFEADTKMRVEIPRYTGTLEESSFNVTLSVGASLALEAMASGRAFSAVYMTIWERRTGEGESTTLTLFSGFVDTATANPGGEQGVVKLTARPELDILLDRPMGGQMNPQCLWRFMDSKTCRVSTAVPIGNVLISELFNAKLTLSGFSPPHDRWKGGRVEKDGVQIRIREYIASDTIYLAQLPPVEWVDLAQNPSSLRVTLYPGCLKFIDSCRAWGNEQNFGGVGISTPDYNPIFETG